jgi:hypothetical protein
MLLCGPDSTMALFEDLLHAADGDALGLDALLRDCKVEICKSPRLRRVLVFARGSLDHYVQDREALLSRLEFT